MALSFLLVTLKHKIYIIIILMQLKKLNNFLAMAAVILDL